MRLPLAAPLLIALPALSACGNSDNDFAPVCAEQAVMAEQGRTDGVDITITCP
jgi:hypothetical protein